MVGGIAQKGRIEGYDKNGLFPGFKEVSYSLYQAGAGYEYTTPQSAIKLAVAGSALFYNYTLKDQKSTSASTILPGLNMNVRIPFVKFSSFIGLEFIADFTLAPAVNATDLTEYFKSYKPLKTSMTFGSLGLALSLRGK